jgi:NAD(P)-dependent dehydrogenase (short-subunit alcohol dehydrogenase family)
VIGQKERKKENNNVYKYTCIHVLLYCVVDSSLFFFVGLLVFFFSVCPPNIIMFSIISLAIVLYVSYRLYQHFFPTPNINPNNKYVLISGCDTGFGHGLAVELDKQGFNVLAGVFVADTVSSLKSKLSSKATVFRLDITKQEDIDAAFDLVNEKTKVLHALVNNAGIAAGNYIDWTSVEVMRKVMDVNFFGHVAMTKKFLPLLIAKRDSRVVNICSVAGYLASSSMSAYCASKFALESFSDCLRREMFPWNLRVSIIEPGFMRTPIIEMKPKPFPDFWNSLANDVQERWGEDFLKAQLSRLAKSELLKYAEDPIKVVRALQHAVMNTVPHIRYRPGWQSGVVFFPISMLPAWMTDWLLRKLFKSTILPAGVHKQLKG